MRGIAIVSPKISYEIIVVDNASGDGVGEMLKEEFPHARFIQSETNIGFAAGNNLGMERAGGRYIMIMNPDIIVNSGSFEALVHFMDENPDVGLAGPKLLNPDRTIQDSAYRFPRTATPVYRRTMLGKVPAGKREVSRYLMKDWDHKSSMEVDWLLGACLIARKIALDEVGPFDERYFLYFEDTDWCRRFWERKWKVAYVTSSVMIHFHRRESADTPLIQSLFNKITREHIKSSIKYFLKYWGRDNPRAD